MNVKSYIFRYYGTSMPFGNKSLDNEHIGYLTAAQALADYADLIDFLQGESMHPRYPVIAFGGKRHFKYSNHY